MITYLYGHVQIYELLAEIWDFWDAGPKCRKVLAMVFTEKSCWFKLGCDRQLVKYDISKVWRHFRKRVEWGNAGFRNVMEYFLFSQCFKAKLNLSNNCVIFLRKKILYKISSMFQNIFPDSFFSNISKIFKNVTQPCIGRHSTSNSIFANTEEEKKIVFVWQHVNVRLCAPVSLLLTKYIVPFGVYGCSVIHVLVRTTIPLDHRKRNRQFKHFLVLVWFELGEKCSTQSVIDEKWIELKRMVRRWYFQIEKTRRCWTNAKSN